MAFRANESVPDNRPRKHPCDQGHCNLFRLEELEEISWLQSKLFGLHSAGFLKIQRFNQRPSECYHPLVAQWRRSRSCSVNTYEQLDLSLPAYLMNAIHHATLVRWRDIDRMGPNKPTIHMGFGYKLNPL